ncbi:inositol monophosphatase [Novosphingobium sp. Rr 2-17]|uniref:inositol monophosphatase family protein n=1 Tax=Novosphingobium sp. Rr 2-17 TaxID=555793 RepID=UPI0002699B60|nr:inositol monophosphatase family protein [Novosphingobium sp. Rr 2-17]EIZ80463.1 inositol monophosphatase [Novosphingobium sp. Rr 2-17]
MITQTLHTAVETVMRQVNAQAIVPRYQTLSAAEIVEKAADDMVTIADRESEAMLTEQLAALLPEADVVGEEAVYADASVMERLKDRLCWIVDPLDGTNNFASGKPPFGMLVALADKGEILGGWILDCLTGRFCKTNLGGGAFIDGQRIGAQVTGEAPPVAAISTLFADPERRTAMMEHVAPHYRLVDIPRCAAEQYPRLVLGVNDLSVFERTLPWDHAAGALFLNEAGGRCSRPDGSQYRVDEYEKRGLIAAASPALWDVFAQRLAAI